MRRTLAVVAAAASMLVVAPSVALADDPTPPAPDNTLPVPPEFAPPAATPVTDVPTAENFLRRVAARRAARFLGVENRRRVRVLDVEARCLEHPAVADRFGCAFTLRAAVIQRSRGWDGYHGKAPEAVAASRGKYRKVRVRTYGCLGLARIIGGPTVTPSVTIPLIECARVPRGDWDAPEPAPVQ